MEFWFKITKYSTPYGNEILHNHNLLGDDDLDFFELFIVAFLWRYRLMTSASVGKKCSARLTKENG
jgi:hypothetical protein